MKTDVLVTAQVLAEALRLSKDTIWRYTREGKIPFVRLGAQYRYRLDEVLDALSSVAVGEEKGDYGGRAAGPLTYEDYLLLPETPGYSQEIIEGELVQDPAPAILHQYVSQRLFKLIEEYFSLEKPRGLVLYAPVDVTLGEHTVVQPDILFIAKESRDVIRKKRIAGAPTLVVEIISASTRSKDSVRKLQLYQKAGVTHYWLVDPENKTIQAFLLGDRGYILAAMGEGEDILHHPEFPGLEIPLADLWNLESKLGE